jgi:hypothetical protein
VKCLRRPRNKSLIREQISSAKEQAMLQQRFLQPIFLAINRFQGRAALRILQTKRIGKLLDKI